MFNAPRPGQLRYNNTASANGLAASYLADNPLSASIYSDDGQVDPWSAAPSPPPPPELPGVFSRIIADATAPSIYTEAFAAADPNFTGDMSLSALNRILATSKLPHATIDRIVNLVSSRPRVSKLEFFVAMALVALAQQGKDLSIEQVASIAQQSQTLPSPQLDLSQLQASTFAEPSAPPQINGHSNAYEESLSSPQPQRLPPVPAYSESDPWNSNFRNGGTVVGSSVPATTPGGSALMGGLPSNWWNRQKTVTIIILPEKQGFILNRYTVYVIQTEAGAQVNRRYSEFVFLWDCLVKRYPFRILPHLPPKRLGPDASFLEQRRKGLNRFLNFVINHPIISTDGVLSAFLSESSFETWRKNSTGISLEEESSGKRIDRTEEMSIPSDLEEKMAVLRGRLPALVEHWTRICTIADRTVRRREASAGDLSRLHMTLNALTEQNAVCWHLSDPQGECSLSSGVRQGLKTVSGGLLNQADALDHRAQALQSTGLEQLKGQRDLYIAARDLFARHIRLSPDRVDMLKRRVEVNGRKLEAVKAAKKDGYEVEADKIAGLIEKDHVDIATCMTRRVFIRHCMWYELRVVLHNRENTLVTQAVQALVTQERDFAHAVVGNWSRLVEDIEGMPFE
ncbi:Sorting nexin mvp1 [Tulasnella sp. JGI-2019a]|nr:Sorting nexin mvp1 [Tulasnella sp. JGI-2019a]KAG9012222.1 Sorting nexin mvp1 [Tulasnella sp. JGI-2019a]KAG9036317.1 Sorting nexin mvp1 [Tulasnella sp. JGI-2019a]